MRSATEESSSGWTVVFLQVSRLNGSDIRASCLRCCDALEGVVLDRVEADHILGAGVVDVVDRHGRVGDISGRGNDKERRDGDEEKVTR